MTVYTYVSNAAAVREAAGLEAESLAGDLTQRMQLVTTQISERVEHLMDVQRQADAAASRISGEAGTRASGAAASAPSQPVEPAIAGAAPAAEDTVAEALGEVAMLLNNIEVRGLRPPGGGRGPALPSAPPGPPADWRGGERGFRADRGRRGEVIVGQPLPLPTALPPSSTTQAPSAQAVPRVPPVAVPDVPPVPVVEPLRDMRPDWSGAPADRGFRGGAESAAGRAGGAPAFGDGSAPAGDGTDRDRIMFDMMPIRREMIEQLVGSSEEWQRLSPEERQRVIGEVNQRMLGIVQGIQMGAAELQKKVSEAQRLADEKAQATALAAASRQAAAGRKRAAAAAGPAARAATGTAGSAAAAVGTSGPTRRRTALSGSRLDVTVERNGQVLRAANAEVNLPNLLATVFTTTRRDRGEVPFAFGKDGRLYTPTEEDRTKVESLGGGVVRPDGPLGTTVLADWIVVTTTDPTGSGLKFGIARPVGESLTDLRRAGVRSAGLGLACIGLALVGIVPLSSRLTRNLSKLNDGVHRIAEGDYSARVEVGSNDEMGKLARAFNHMAEDVERHQHAVVEQERIRRELELGRQIQIDMLPQGPLRLGLTEIKGVSVPAREVGGDFFNYFQLTDGELALLVGDVSGKGVGAALLMANIQASLRTRLALGQDLGVHRAGD